MTLVLLSFGTPESSEGSKAAVMVGTIFTVVGGLTIPLPSHCGKVFLPL